MLPGRKEEIRQQLIGFYRSYQNDGEPIAVNFRELVKELSKPERFTHLIHSYPAKLLANIPFFFFASDELCPKNGVVLDPFCGTGTVLLEAALRKAVKDGLAEAEYTDGKNHKVSMLIEPTCIVQFGNTKN